MRATVVVVIELFLLAGAQVLVDIMHQMLGQHLARTILRSCVHNVTLNCRLSGKYFDSSTRRLRSDVHLRMRRPLGWFVCECVRLFGGLKSRPYHNTSQQQLN